MKFIHIADMHLDSPFANLSEKEQMGEKRRLEQRQVFKKIIDYIIEKEIDMLFIAGDLYEQNYIKKSTIEYINEQFKRIPNSKIYITPGNHDPYIQNSYYAKYDWNENVTIFKGKIQKESMKKGTEEIDIYGYGFESPYVQNLSFEGIEVDKEIPSILIMHADLDIKESVYNPIEKETLIQKGFNYVALGHIHKKNLDEQNAIHGKIIYPGSTVSLGFDELGSHGMVVGEIDKYRVKIDYVELDQTEFKEFLIDVTDITYFEDLIEKLNDMDIKNNEYAKIVFEGKRNFEIDLLKVKKLIQNERILKIKDNTKIKYNLEILAREQTLKGIFTRKMLEKINEEIDDKQKEKIERALEIGLEALE